MKHSFNIIFALVITSIINFSPISINALQSNWVGVPSSTYGEQVWDKNNIFKNDDGSIRVFSKFIPKIKNKITKEILYTMDINCYERTFRDVAVGERQFDEFKNINVQWQYPNGDELIIGVIEQVCSLNETI